MNKSSKTQSASPAATQKPAAGSSVKDLLGLMPYLRRYGPSVALGICTLVLTSLITAVFPLATGIITDMLEGNPEPFQAGSQPRLFSGPWLSHAIPLYEPHSRLAIGIYCLVLILCALVKGVTSFTTRWILFSVSREVEHDIRNDLLDRLLLMEPEFYIRNHTGELMSRAMNDLNNVSMVVGPGIISMGQTLTGTVLALTIMWRLSWSLTFWVLLPVLVVFVALGHFGKVIHSLYEKIQASLATLSARTQENLSGVRVIRAYAQEEAESRAFDESNRDFVGRNIELIRTWSMFTPSLQALISISFIIVLWVGGRQIVKHEISLGTFVAFYGYLGLLVLPVIRLGWVTNVFQRGAASFHRVDYILRTSPQIDDRFATISANRHIQGEIEFRGLSFAFPTTTSGNTSLDGSSSNGKGNRPVLRGINLKIPAGSTLAIVGPTGSGKTTLAALIARLWEAPAGELLIDGCPIRNWPLETIRRSIGYVPQDSCLFNETVGENIAFGLSQYDESRVRAAAEVASINADVETFTNKYHTIIGERGVTLSGGQRQRMSIARAIVRDPRILILDDSLSNVDTQTEERILSRLRAIMAGRTTVLISHRTSTVCGADQIVVLHEGCIIEGGTHDELLARGGYYADLHQKQLLEEELERA